MAVAAAGIAAGGSLIGGVLGGKGAKKAAQIQAAAADRATQAQQAQFDKQVQIQAPFVAAGQAGEERLLTLLGINPNAGKPAASQNAFTTITGPNGEQYQIPNGMGQQQQDSGLTVDPNSPDFGKYAKDFSMADFQADPGYAFRMSEGMKALDNSFAARGLGVSGANIKGAINYGQGAASQEYTNAFNRYQVNRSNQINPLQSLFGAGQSTANTLSNAAQNLGNNQAELQLQAGNARASGYVGQANALTNAISGGISAYTGIQNSNALNNFLNNASQSTFGGGPSNSGAISFLDNYFAAHPTTIGG